MGRIMDKLTGEQMTNHYFFHPSLIDPAVLPRKVLRVDVPGFLDPLYCCVEMAEALERLKRDGQPDTARTYALWFGAEKFARLAPKG